MSRPAHSRDEFGLLIAALCDGEITSDQTARLEQLVAESSEARQYFLHYILLHGELYWEHAASAGRRALSTLEPAPSAQSPGVPLAKAAGPRGTRRWAPGRFRWTAGAAAAAAVLLVAILGFRSYRQGPSKPAGAPPAAVARLARTLEARWFDGQVYHEGTNLDSGQTLSLREGLAEIHFNSGAGVILQGPAAFDVLTPARGFLHEGSLTASVPARAAGFAIQTPMATVVDRGTEFGLIVDETGPSEVHVFAGRVEVQLESGPGARGIRREVDADHAVKIAPSAEGRPPRVSEIALAAAGFARTFPRFGSVARFRGLVARHPDLIHHYTFEGRSSEENRRDEKGGLDLLEVRMYAGDGDGRLTYRARGLDPTTNAIRPLRAPGQGGASGMGLASDLLFDPPPAFSVELLLRFDGFGQPGEQEPAVAVATRESARICGFFVAVAGDGQLVHLMDGDADWVEGEIRFAPGEWYYVASTFRVDSGQTIVNSYVGNLSRRQRDLQWVVRDQAAKGVPACSRLGIGKGSARDMSHAYPWCGALDEVAIYRAALDRDTFQQHVQALVAGE